MAQVNAIHMALGQIGFSNEAANYITSDQNGQGMSSLAEFAVLTDDEVKNLCKVVCRPGGMMQNPNAAAPPGADAAAAAAAAAATAQPAQIPNPGLTVMLCTENDLKLACYFLCYKEHTSPVVTADVIMLASVWELCPYHEWEKTITMWRPRKSMQKIGIELLRQLRSICVVVLVFRRHHWHT